MKFEVLEGLYPDSRKAGSNNFDLTPIYQLDAAIETVSCSDNKPVVHSDRGAHYRWP